MKKSLVYISSIGWAAALRRSDRSASSFSIVAAEPAMTTEADLSKAAQEGTNATSTAQAEITVATQSHTTIQADLDTVGQQVAAYVDAVELAKAVDAAFPGQNNQQKQADFLKGLQSTIKKKLEAIGKQITTTRNETIDAEKSIIEAQKTATAALNEATQKTQALAKIETDIANSKFELDKFVENQDAIEKKKNEADQQYVAQKKVVTDLEEQIKKLQAQLTKGRTKLNVLDAANQTAYSAWQTFSAQYQQMATAKADLITSQTAAALLKQKAQQQAEAEALALSTQASAAQSLMIQIKQLNKQLTDSRNNIAELANEAFLKGVAANATATAAASAKTLKDLTNQANNARNNLINATTNEEKAKAALAKANKRNQDANNQMNAACAPGDNYDEELCQLAKKISNSTGNKVKTASNQVDKEHNTTSDAQNNHAAAMLKKKEAMKAAQNLADAAETAADAEAQKAARTLATATSAVAEAAKYKETQEEKREEADAAYKKATQLQQQRQDALNRATKAYDDIEKMTNQTQKEIALATANGDLALAAKLKANVTALLEDAASSRSQALEAKKQADLAKIKAVQLKEKADAAAVEAADMQKQAEDLQIKADEAALAAKNSTAAQRASAAEQKKRNAEEQTKDDDAASAYATGASAYDKAIAQLTNANINSKIVKSNLDASKAAIEKSQKNLNEQRQVVDKLKQNVSETGNTTKLNKEQQELAKKNEENLAAAEKAAEETKKKSRRPEEGE